jgi:hypothetical protein
MRDAIERAHPVAEDLVVSLNSLQHLEQRIEVQ